MLWAQEILFNRYKFELVNNFGLCIDVYTGQHGLSLIMYYMFQPAWTFVRSEDFTTWGQLQEVFRSSDNQMSEAYERLSAKENSILTRQQASRSV